LIQGEAEKGQKRKSVVREYAEAIAIAILLALLIRTFIVQAFKIPSGSMIPTLQVGDHILVNKFIYATKIPFTDMRILPVRDPERLDIIVFKYPEDESKDFIKRIIGTPGDAVEIRDKVIYINGQPLVESYAIHQEPSMFSEEIQPRDNFGPVVIPEDSYFVMGDNRDQSLDSRFWGVVKAGKIKGKAFIIYWSWDRENMWPRWKRIGMFIS
jgi:signal peptidase I